MDVKQAVEQLAYGTSFLIQGTHSGKVYYRSWVNKKERLEKYAGETVNDEAYFATLFTSSRKTLRGTPYTFPAVGVWMHDYYLCHPEEKGERKA